ncbi:MAG: 4-hydroxy-tetrahydrodipicolinate reductase [Fastidiosipilaceae bacterium]|nr:4-hydroxy-tetrahydrodipicolinate reductase [Clostridiaceae bacterium]
MVNIFLSGCCGRMGNVISQVVSAREDCQIVGGFDQVGKTNMSYPVFTSTDEVDVDYDVVIDFSNSKNLPNLIALSERNAKPLVIATTGFSVAESEQIDELSKSIPVFTSANMSLGINILIHLAKTAARTLYPDFNIEIIEAHHNQKLDAPSGTAIMIADAIKSVLNDDVFYRYERESIREKRKDNEIGISAIRGGTIVGEHDVILAGGDEVIKLSHSAQSREIFARGAVSAALYLNSQKPGLYHMDDLIESASVNK